MKLSTPRELAEKMMPSAFVDGARTAVELMDYAVRARDVEFRRMLLAMKEDPKYATAESGVTMSEYESGYRTAHNRILAALNPSPPSAKTP
jgi:hypothetical protein